MSNINHLEMAAELTALPEITVKKSMFGLSTSVIYAPTNSKITTRQNEYSAESGERLEKILEAAPESVPGMIEKTKIQPASLGNIRLDICLSQDHQFAAVQLLRFADFTYHPLTDMKVYKGKAAEAIASLY